jgi:pre-mRNA-processing factor SLU7
LTHKTKDCVDRPRKSGAKWTGKNIQPDEYINKLELAWDAKRDRWNGYVINILSQ